MPTKVATKVAMRISSLVELVIPLHGEVIVAQEVEVRLPPGGLGLIVLDDLEPDSVLGDNRLEIGLNIADLPQNIDELDVIEPVPGEARDLRGVCEPVDELVVEVTASRHDEALVRRIASAR